MGVELFGLISNIDNPNKNPLKYDLLMTAYWFISFLSLISIFSLLGNRILFTQINKGISSEWSINSPNDTSITLSFDNASVL